MEQYPQATVYGKSPVHRGPGQGFMVNAGLNEFAGISPPNQRYHQEQEELQQEEEVFHNQVPVVSTPEEQRALQRWVGRTFLFYNFQLIVIQFIDYAKAELINKPKNQADLNNGGAVLEMLNK